jgi:hypothetical protein
VRRSRPRKRRSQAARRRFQLAAGGGPRLASLKAGLSRLAGSLSRLPGTVYRLPASLRNSLRASCDKAKAKDNAKPESKFCKWLGPAAASEPSSEANGDAFKNLTFKDGKLATDEERKGLHKLEKQLEALDTDREKFWKKDGNARVIKKYEYWKGEWKRTLKLFYAARLYLTSEDTAENYEKIRNAVNLAVTENRQVMVNIAAVMPRYRP